MALLPEQQLIGSVFGYTPMTVEEGSEPADTNLCSLPVQERDGWPYVKFKNEWYGVPSMEEVEEWVFDSVCLLLKKMRLNLIILTAGCLSLA